MRQKSFPFQRVGTQRLQPVSYTHLTLPNTVKQKYVIFCRILPQDGRTRIPAGLPEFHVGKNSFHSNIWKVHIKKQLQAIGGGNAINSLRPAEHCSDCHHRIE